MTCTRHHLFRLWLLPLHLHFFSLTSSLPFFQSSFYSSFPPAVSYLISLLIVFSASLSSRLRLPNLSFSLLPLHYYQTFLLVFFFFFGSSLVCTLRFSVSYVFILLSLTIMFSCFYLSLSSSRSSTFLFSFSYIFILLFLTITSSCFYNCPFRPPASQPSSLLPSSQLSSSSSLPFLSSYFLQLSRF